MKKGKIFTNCFSTIFAILVIISFISCTPDNDVTSIIDERVPLEVDAPSTITPEADSNNQDSTSQDNNSDLQTSLKQYEDTVVI